MRPLDYIEAVLPHLGTVIGFALGFILIARLMGEKRRPSNTVAWLLMIVLVPYVGVPLYILLGGRKIAKRARAKASLDLHPENTADANVSISPFGIVTRGNRCAFQHDGQQAFDSLIESIQNAKHSIDIATFILSRDVIGRRIVKALTERANAGVSVRLLIDAVGSFGKKTLYLRDLEKAGGKVARFMPVFPILSRGRANLRNHRKIAIFDDRAAIIGGRNIGREYMSPTPQADAWQDLGLRIEGPAVEQLITIFDADWAFAYDKKATRSRTPHEHKPTPPDQGITEIMASGPDTRGDPLYEKILSVIHDAQRHITLVTPYYIPDEVLQRSLIVKARMGKTVKLIVPRRSNHRITDLARNHYLRELSNAGAKILLYDNGMMHGKALLVDDNVAMTGSANIDLRSLFYNYEVAAFFYSPSEIAEIKTWIQELESRSIPFEESIPAKPNLLRDVAEDLSRLVTPLL